MQKPPWRGTGPDSRILTDDNLIIPCPALPRPAHPRSGKDALLLDMAEIRRHGKTQLRELLDELKQFDRCVRRDGLG